MPYKLLTNLTNLRISIKSTPASRNFCLPIRPLSWLAVNFTAGSAFSQLISRFSRDFRGGGSLAFFAAYFSAYSRLKEFVHRGPEPSPFPPHQIRFIHGAAACFLIADVFFADHIQCITGLFLMQCVYCATYCREVMLRDMQFYRIRRLIIDYSTMKNSRLIDRQFISN